MVETAALLDRLRTNLRAARIPATEEDVQGVVGRGFLNSVLAFEGLLGDRELDLPPDHLADTSPPPRPTTATGATGHAADRKDEHGSVAGIADRIRRREVSPLEITRACLRRIAERDPELNAFQLVLHAGAEDMARRAEAEIARGEYRGPLHGVPVAVKDLLDLAGTVTTGGSVVLSREPAGEDAWVVRRLKEAGAVIVGKTRLSELAYSPGSNNGHFGPTRNPWNPQHDTGGSSSGSAAAVADWMACAAVGSDTGGSIRIPAALCGLVGLKPTYGRVGMSGAVSLSWSLDHLGPLTRTVEDAALMLGVLAGPDPHDHRTRPGTGYADVWIESPDLCGQRIGVLTEDGHGSELGSPEALEAWRSGLGALEQAGAGLEPVALPERSALRTVNSTFLVLEAAAYHYARMRARLPEFGEFARHRLLYAYAHGPTAYVQAQRLRTMLRARVEERLAGLGLLCTPTMPDGAPLLGVPSDIRYTAPFNCLGWPAVTVPVGLTAQSLPLGLQLIGRPWQEKSVMEAARVVEIGSATSWDARRHSAEMPFPG